VFRHIQYIKVETAATGENSHLFFSDKERKPACSRNRSFCYKALKVQNAFSCVSVTQFSPFSRLLLRSLSCTLSSGEMENYYNNSDKFCCHNRKFLEHIRIFSNKTAWCTWSMCIIIKRNTLPGLLQCAGIPTAFTTKVTLLKCITWENRGRSKVPVTRILNLDTKRRWESDQLHVPAGLLSPDMHWKGGQVCRDYWLRRLVITPIEVNKQLQLLPGKKRKFNVGKLRSFTIDVRYYNIFMTTP